MTIPITLSGVRDALHAHQCTAMEVMKACLTQQDALSSRLNVFAERADAETLLDQAGHVDRLLDRGDVLGPLAGIPIAVKDVFLTADMPTTASSAVLKGFRSQNDATVVSRLRQAGAIIVGKTQTHEFAYGPTTDNMYAGPSHNPWDYERIPGGSSGGSAIAVATGMCLGATGSDTGGSIRIPSGLCGITGLKPTYGRVSRHGTFPLSWSLDHIGPMARSVEDVALLLQVMAGHDSLDPASANRPVPNYLSHLQSTPLRLRIGVPQDYFLKVVDKEVHSAFEAALEVLESLGWLVEPVSFASLKYAAGAELAIISAEASAYHRKSMERSAGLYSRDVRIELDAGMMISATDYLMGQRARRLIRDEFSDVLTNVDILAVPTLPLTAPKLGTATVEVGGTTMSTLSALWHNVFPLNLTGLPAMSVPCGFSDTGLPIGLQLIGRGFEEALLLRVGQAYQMKCDWHRRLPSAVVSQQHPA
ncbi:amidase [Aminobacter sp. MDW-2]|uniref:amidase n=1 Tax=Aminobacter sp. MDW-2 TaxID=2666139 RepID=UPI0012AFC711|nr:amidase [Aminobacter sp. MDW-2]MRX37576.1 Asp-tRNA(Asn)/Glu-tRNA(Gln) amidotransferase GatCAB subunit A [Aminobacter sp. MDW-2]QNH37886.1 aspartyl/glutamyl-tRNA amidotransferase subunit A [Aminobacter sp. MDW-2]